MYSCDISMGSRVPEILRCHFDLQRQRNFKSCPCHSLHYVSSISKSKICRVTETHVSFVCPSVLMNRFSYSLFHSFSYPVLSAAVLVPFSAVLALTCCTRIADKGSRPFCLPPLIIVFTMSNFWLTEVLGSPCLISLPYSPRLTWCSVLNQPIFVLPRLLFGLFLLSL
jgi:hypothetical protein